MSYHSIGPRIFRQMSETPPAELLRQLVPDDCKPLIKPGITSDTDMIDELLSQASQSTKVADPDQLYKIRSYTNALAVCYTKSQINSLQNNKQPDLDTYQRDNATRNAMATAYVRKLIDRLALLSKQCETLMDENEKIKKQKERVEAERDEVLKKLRQLELKQSPQEDTQADDVFKNLQEMMQNLKREMEQGPTTVEHHDDTPTSEVTQKDQMIEDLTDKLEKEKREELAEAERKRQTQEKEMTELIKNQGRVISGMLQMMREFGSKLGEDVSPLNEEEFGRHMADQNPWVILECMKKIFEAVNKQ